MLRLVSRFPRRVIRRCPAIRFAVSRTHRVIGRIRFLVSSIKTINIMRAVGVPCGSRWESIWLVLLYHPNIITVSHMDSDSGIVNDKCEVTEKFCGYKAEKFKRIIIKKRVITISSVPFSVFTMENFTSFLKFRVIEETSLLQLLFVNHIFFLIRIKEINGIPQERDKNVDLGSKTENKLFIILCFFLFFFVLLGLRVYMKFSGWLI